MIVKNKPFLFSFLSIVLLLFSCSDSGNNKGITNKPQTKLPDDFDHSAYWENHDNVQENCGKIDSLCIEEHWINIGEPAGLSYLPVEKKSSENGLSSETPNTENSSGLLVSSSKETSSSSESSYSSANNSSSDFSHESSSSSEEKSSSSSSVVIQTVSTPEFSVIAGTYTTPQSVEISTSTAGAAIYYTVNGSTPSTSSTLYSRALAVSATQTIKAIAGKIGWNNSEIASREYVIHLLQNPQSCLYNSSSNTLACAEKIYNTTTIGTQVWMAENLNYEASSGSYCYNNDTDHCDTYGRLYTWSAAMGGASSSSSSPNGIQGVCPKGWHVPSDAEWITLSEYVNNHNGSDGVGKSLKANSSLWNTTNTGTDAYGFSGLPGGRCNSSGSDYNVGAYGYWWSSTEASSTRAYRRSLYHNNDYFLRYYDDKSLAYSVRCLQDTP